MNDSEFLLLYKSLLAFRKFLLHMCLLEDDPIYSDRGQRKKIGMVKRIQEFSFDNVEFEVPLTYLSGMSSRQLRKVKIDQG